MADQVEELLVRTVEVGVVNVDVATEDEVTNMCTVVQRAVAHDARSGHVRRLLLVYHPASITAVAEAMRTASEAALADGALADGAP
jgi:hypothetical protein